MTYVVLARKYRPQRFEDMIGQEHVGRTLGNAIRQNRVHHAYLFTGARGLGKTTTARIFAKALVCEHGPTPEPCNACAQCIAVNQGRSIDVIEIDGASNNGVDNIRSLREQVNYLPQAARRKVYIIDEVHMLSTAAWNALLKTLEEPPPHVNFIFATTEPQKVLATILSRVNRLDFRRVSIEETIAHLRSILDREQLGVDDGGLRLVARAAGGSVRDALTLLDQVLAFASDSAAVSEDEVRRVLGQADRFAIAELVGAVLVRDPDAVMTRLDGLVGAGIDLVVLSLQILEHLRDLVLVRACRTRDVFPGITTLEYEALQRAVHGIDAATLGQVFDRFSRVVDRLPDSRVPRLLVEMALVELAYEDPVIPLGDLVERLRGLAEGQSGPSGPGGSGSAPPSRGSRSGATRGGGREDRGFSSFERPVAEARESEIRDRKADIPVTVNGSSAPLVQPQSNDRALDSRELDDSSLMAGLWNMAAGTVFASDDGGVALSAETPREHSAQPAPRPSGPKPASQSSASTARDTPRPSPQPFSSNAARDTPRPSPQPFSSNAARDTLAPQPPANAARDTPRPPPSPAASTPRSPGPTRPSVPERVAVDPVETNAEGTSAFEIWETLVARIRQDDEHDAAFLADVGVVAIDGGVIRLAAPAGYTHEHLQAGALRARIEQAARERFGRAFQVELMLGEPSLPDVPSLALVSARRRDDHRRAIEAEAREHDGILRLIRTFNGTLASVKPIPDPPAGTG